MLTHITVDVQSLCAGCYCNPLVAVYTSLMIWRQHLREIFRHSKNFPYLCTFKTKKGQPMKRGLKIKLLLAFWPLSVMLMMLACCGKNSEQHPSTADVPLVIFDTDIGSSTDDLFALEMLYRYEEQGLCRLLGVVVDREGSECAACADVMNTYFDRGDVPIGLVRNGINNPAVWIDYGNLPNHTHPDGSLMFARTVSDYSTLPDGWQLYRRLLAAQPGATATVGRRRAFTPHGCGAGASEGEVPIPHGWHLRCGRRARLQLLTRHRVCADTLRPLATRCRHSLLTHGGGTTGGVPPRAGHCRHRQDRLSPHQAGVYDLQL